jgi:hypothetical protein
LAARLASLRAERDQELAETIPIGDGDVADRATNVNGHVRLAMLEDRITTVEEELAAFRETSNRSSEGGVSVGDIVTLDLGDGDETFLLGSVDEATDSLMSSRPAAHSGKRCWAPASAPRWLTGLDPAARSARGSSQSAEVDPSRRARHGAVVANLTLG